MAFERTVDGTFTDVGPPINKHQAYAGGINDSGAIAGSVLSVAFVSENGIYAYFGDQKQGANANGINNNGTSVGALTVSTREKVGCIESQRARPYILYLGSGAAFFGLNNDETAVGIFQDEAGIHGFTWTESGSQTLNVPGATSTGAFGINDSGALVGTTNLGQLATICGGAGPTSQGLYTATVSTAHSILREPSAPLWRVSITQASW